MEKVKRIVRADGRRQFIQHDGDKYGIRWAVLSHEAPQAHEAVLVQPLPYDYTSSYRAVAIFRHDFPTDFVGTASTRSNER